MRLLVCDVEGTIFKARYRIDGTDYASTMWQPLAKSLGEEAIERERLTHELWEKGHYPHYPAWVEDTIRIHKDFGLHKDTFHALIEGAEYMEGVREFFGQLDRREFLPVLISGGFQELIKRAQKDLGIKYGYGACEYFFDETDGKLSWHSLKSCDFEGKYDSIKMLLRDNDISEWIFIGDGKNDLHIAKKATLAIGINPHPLLAEVVHHQVADFSGIAPIIDEFCETQRLACTLTSFPTTTFTKTVKQKANDAKGKEERQQKIESNRVAVSDNDYLNSPKISLQDILSERKVVFFGLRESSEQYQALADFHSNLKIIDGSDKSYDKKSLKYADFLFMYTAVSGHSAGWRTDYARRDLPYAQLDRKRNRQYLLNAMANVLCRYFDL